jgi:G:T/U-mismatch repair DNA glycosylase
MVLVGHSMGGLVSRLQVTESGNDFWRIVSDKRFEDLKTDAETREKLRRILFFEPNPSIRRVVTIGTPHRGSDFANDATRYLGRKLIALPKRMVQTSQRLVWDNPDFFKNMELLTTTTSIDSLAPDSPIFPVLNRAPHAEWTHLHNIAGVIAKQGLLGHITETGDGIVDFDSAHWEEAESEMTVEADHVNVHRHPRSVLEVRRILLEHLRELEQPPPLAPVSVDATRQPSSSSSSLTQSLETALSAWMLSN